MESQQEIVKDTLERLVNSALERMQNSDVAAKTSVQALEKSCDAIVENTAESPETRQRLDEYIGQMCDVASKQFQYLYVQGAKDCVTLLRELGVLR